MFIGASREVVAAHPRGLVGPQTVGATQREIPAALVESLARRAVAPGAPVDPRVADPHAPRTHFASGRHAVAAGSRIDQFGLARPIPAHVLIETHGALREVEEIAALPGIETLDFGLMDFISGHHGAIPAAAMKSPGQFEHPLVARAKCAIAAAAREYNPTFVTMVHCETPCGTLTPVEAIGQRLREVAPDALAQNSPAAPPAKQPETQPAANPLGGPKIDAPPSSAASLVSTDFNGTVRRLETTPEEALSLIHISEPTRPY